MAHDFNNMLGVIPGYVEMAMNDVHPDSKFYLKPARMLLAANEPRI